MIIGIGVDNVELSRISSAKEKDKFPAKVLTSRELEQYRNLSGKRQTEFLAGRWAAKEAFAKAYGTGISSALAFTDLEITADEKGKPFFKQQPFHGKAHLSISHTDIEAIAFVVLESENEL